MANKHENANYIALTIHHPMKNQRLAYNISINGAMGITLKFTGQTHSNALQIPIATFMHTYGFYIINLDLQKNEKNENNEKNEKNVSGV